MNAPDDWPPELSALNIPAPSRDFAARIIAAAEAKPENSVMGWREYLSLLLPKPALGVAFGLILGVLLGWEGGNIGLLSDMSYSLSTVEPAASITVLDTFHFNSGSIL